MCIENKNGFIMILLKERDEIMTKEELVKAKLNMLTILDLNLNYNKSELERMFTRDTEEMKTLKDEIKDILSSIYSTDEYLIDINGSFIRISKIIARTENSIRTQEHKVIWSDNFRKLPYSYVMGKKMGKKAYLETLKVLS